jgi:hypothetical protein
LLQASQVKKSSGEFTTMKEREKQSRLINQHRASLRRQKELEKEQSEREERLERRRELRVKADPYNGQTWREIAQEQEDHRRLSIERRSQELASKLTAFVPNKGSEGTARLRAMERIFPTEPPMPFTADDPKKVSADSYCREMKAVINDSRQWKK